MAQAIDIDVDDGLPTHWLHAAYAGADAPLSVAIAHAVAVSDVDENTYDKEWTSLSRSLPDEWISRSDSENHRRLTSFCDFIVKL